MTWISQSDEGMDSGSNNQLINTANAFGLCAFTCSNIVGDR